MTTQQRIQPASSAYRAGFAHGCALGGFAVYSSMAFAASSYLMPLLALPKTSCNRLSEDERTIPPPHPEVSESIV